jgi:hypothetical protein
MLTNMMVRLTVGAMLVGSAVHAQERRTLGHALVSLEQAHRLTVVVDPAVRLDVPATLHVSALEPAAALGTLLRGYDFFLQFSGSTRATPGRLQRVWVFPRGAAEAVRVGRERDLSAGRSARDFGANLREALAQSAEDAATLIALAVDDVDENVRRQALEAVVQEALPVPRSLLEGAFMGDTSEAVRVAAFDALVAQADVDGTDVAPTIDLALQDPSPLLRERARDVLESRPRPPGLD